MKYYIIAGEASGDLHGARLIEAIHHEDPQAEIRCWGGDLMENAGATLVKHYRDLAFMGFWEVFKNIVTILGNIAMCKKDILAYQPDVIVYIDYPGFNLRIAEWAHEKGFKNHYYISPQVWAWKANRVVKMKASLDALYTILPFEKAYFQKNHQYEVTYVGHPLLDSIQASKLPAPYIQKTKDQKPIIALLPGSRKQEVQKMLPLFLEMIPLFPNHEFIIAGTPTLPKHFYTEIIGKTPCTLIIGQTYALLQSAEAAVVTSGTATLECALFGVPQVVCYKTSALSYWLAKKWVTLDAISLVNLILEKKVVTELIQENCHATSLKKALSHILTQEGKTELKEQYNDLRQQLDQGGASQKTAKCIRADLS